MEFVVIVETFYGDVFSYRYGDLASAKKVARKKISDSRVESVTIKKE